MSKIHAFLRRRTYTGLFVAFGASAFGGAAYHYSRSTSEDGTSTLNPREFTPFILASKEPVSSTSSIFTVENHKGFGDEEILRNVWKKAVWSVQVKQPQLQIARAYTPLPPAPTEYEEEYREALQMRFLIRKEEGGEVSNFLHRLPLESPIEFRGPTLEYEIPEDVKEVVFLAGGTGIAPAMQVAQALRDRPGTRMHILWANRRREDCKGGVSSTSSAPAPGRLSGWRSLFGLEESVVTEDRKDVSNAGPIVKELEALRRRSKDEEPFLDIEYYVDEEKTFIKPSTVSKLLRPTSSEDPNSRPDSKLVLVSGPDGFISYWAGKKIWIGGREEQGALGGVLSQLNLQGWKVWKL